ncbi:thioesterase II family protein [Mycobacterium sp. BMJ-28]
MTRPPQTPQHLRAQLALLPPHRRAELAERLRRRHAPVPAEPDRFTFQGSADPALRLFCLPYAGGSAAVFRGWTELLPSWIQVCAVQLPGRDSRLGERPYRRLDPLIADLHQALLPLLDRPFAIFGHSMGALLGFELVRRLRRRGGPQPVHLLLAAFRAPQLPNPNIRIHHLPDEVIKTVLAKEGTPKEVLNSEELMRALLPTLRADFELCDTYEYHAEAPLGIPMSIFGGQHDVRVGKSDLQQWETQAGNGFQLTMLPGSHLFIHDARDLLLHQLSAALTTITATEGDVPA